MARPRNPVKTVKRRLADGSIKTHYYDRETGCPLLGPNLDTQRETKTAPVSGSLAAAIVTYLRNPAYTQKISPGTRDFYRRHLREKLGDVRVKAITPGMVEALKEELQAEQSKANGVLAVLSLVMKRAVRDGLIAINPVMQAGRIAVRKRDEIWSADDEQRALAAFRPSLRLALMLLLFTVQRPSDMLAMTTSQIIERVGKDGRARLYITLRQQKTGELVAVPVHRRLEPWLRERLGFTVMSRQRGLDGKRTETVSLLLVPSPTGRPWSRRNSSGHGTTIWPTPSRRSERNPPRPGGRRHASRRRLPDGTGSGAIRGGRESSGWPRPAPPRRRSPPSGPQIDYCQ